MVIGCERSSVAGVREGAARGWGGRHDGVERVAYSPTTPPFHVHGSHAEASRSRSCRICEHWGLPVDEDAGCWCAAARDEERGRGKGRSKVEQGVRELILFF